eukprot:TRINITY_DN3975_c0_g1_i5.p1 TRINITY_DN3975_c0_g1~~TRINITY_DN3975_c0_g1_i5.p1  ORF type:complete len:495 (-),score=165.75 TRINITY_DN3975_c0_g1_i5:23-1507(-)
MPPNDSSDNFYQNNFNDLDSNFGEKMSFEQNDSLKQFCTYEPSAFKSGPRSNKLSISPSSNIGTPIEPVSIEVAKFANGFEPRIKKGPTFNSPGTSMIEDMKSEMDKTYRGQVNTHYFARPSESPVASERPQRNVYPQLPVAVPNPVPEAVPSARKGKKDTGSSNEASIKEESLGVFETDKKEKNRVSAQKCRMRKKQYVESLEAQIKELNDELAKCKEEIKTLREAQSASLMAESNANEYQANYKKLVSALEDALATQQADQYVQQLIGELNFNYGGSSLSRRIMVDSLAEKMISFALPNSYKYLLWSAESGRSLFDPLYEKKKPKKNQKYLLYEEQQKSQQGLNDIWSVISPDEEKKSFLAKIQPKLIDYKKKIEMRVHSFMKVKNELMLEIAMLGNYVDTEVTSKLWVQDVGRGLLWIESKKHEKELSSVEVFGIEDLELVSSQMGVTYCRVAVCWPYYVITLHNMYVLSLIHICRCRRIERCRSRWSPYH